MSKNLVFTEDLDTIIALGTVIKTQAYFKETLEANNFSVPLGGKLQATDELITLFIEIEKNFDSELFDIFRSILTSKKISETRKEELYILYENSFCLVFSELIPFC
jgi:hypothetical protein